MKTVGKLLLLTCVVVTAAWWSCSGRGDESTAVVKANIEKPAPPIVPRPLPPASETYHGLAWQIHNSKDCVRRAKRQLAEIAELGADTVLISNAGYQEHAGSDTFQIDPAVTPSEEQWLEIFRIAHEAGLRVILMPIILLSDPQGTEWRGVISPPSWDDWFDQYREFLLHFARIAQKGRVEVMTVGSELISTEKYTDRWRQLIRDVRKVYSGRLSYSANWDHYKVVQFWDELDVVGMTSYYKLSEKPNPSLESLVETWKPIKRGILRWQKKVGKPLLFVEVGWCSQEGTSIEPWNYYYNQKVTEAGFEEQTNCYRAFMETWKDTPEVGGIIWWEWTEDNGGMEDFNYTPRNKPAERVLRAWLQDIRRDRHLAEKTHTEPNTELNNNKMHQ